MRALKFYTPLLLIVLAWQAAALTGLVSTRILPSPFAIADALREIADRDLIFHTGISIYRQMTGFLLAAILGTSLGIAMARYEWVRVIFEPLARITYPLPKSALLPLLVLWFGIGNNSKIFAVFLGCLLPVLMSAYSGARGVHPQLAWSARSLGTGPLALLWKVHFAAALPEILSGLRIALALSFTLLVSAEFLIASSGLGFLIQRLGETGQYPAMFAAVLIVALIGFAADRLFVALMNRLLRWQTAA